MRKMLFGMVFCLAVVCVGCNQKTREEVDKEQKTYSPELVVKQDGVRLYRVYDARAHHWVFFTTPTGDVAWKIRGDDDTPRQEFSS